MKSRKQQHNWLVLLVGNGYITLSISILLFGCVSAVTDSSRVLAKDDSSKIAQSPAATKENAERLFEEGMTLYQQGSAESLRQAIQKWQEARLLYRAVGDRGGEATTLHNIGLVYSDLGEKQKALDYYNQALPILRAVGNRGGEAITLNNIGRVYSALGEKQKALDFYNQALPILRAVGDPYLEVTILDNIRALGGF
jgi:tetratricopeptide (TPR) repeat protein